MTTSDPDYPPTVGLGTDLGSSTQGTSMGSSAASTPGSATGSSGASQKAKETAGTAAEETKHVAGVAQDEAKRVVSEAGSQVQNLLGQATSQVEDQSRTQRDRLVETLRTFGDDLEQMASQSNGGPAAQLAHEVADRVRGFTTHVDGREPRDLLDDVRSFARRRPGTFLVGALVTGVVAGRLTRGAKAAHDGGSGGPQTAVSMSQPPLVADVDVRAGVTTTPDVGTAVGEPLAGTGYPQTTPAYPGGSELAGDAGTRGGLS